MKLVIIDHYETGFGRKINIISKHNDDFIKEINEYFLRGAYIFDTSILNKSNKTKKIKKLSEDEKLDIKHAKNILKTFTPEYYKFLKLGHKIEIEFLMSYNFS